MILGLLKMSGARTGYELKALVDSSTQHFWPASYGRIYPELKRLAKEGLVESRNEPQGDRPRTLYSLTQEGERTLTAWLEEPGSLVFELRDEGILRVFVGEAVGPEATLRTIRAMRERAEADAQRLKEMQPFVQDAFAESYPTICIEGGIEFQDWYIAWCRSMEQRIAALEEAQGGD